MWARGAFRPSGADRDCGHRSGNLHDPCLLSLSSTFAPPQSAPEADSSFLLRSQEAIHGRAVAIALEVLPQAGEHAGIARRLAAEDPTGEQTNTLDSWAATTLTELFEAAIRSGDVAAARHFLRLIATRVPDRFGEDRIGQMFDQVAAVDTRRRTAARGVTAAAARSQDFPVA